MVWACDEVRGNKSSIRVVMKMNVEEKRGRGRLKKRWLDKIENDMTDFGGCVGDVENRDKYRGLGQRWLTPKSWEENKGEEEEKYKRV